MNLATRCCLVAGLFVTAAGAIQPGFAQEIIPLNYPYYYDVAEGGIVDAETGLVWGWDCVTAFGITGGNHAGALGFPETYINSEWGYGFEDWRIPSRVELGDGADKGVGQALLDAAALVFEPDREPPIYNPYWSGDPAFKYRGKYYAWAVRLSDGSESQLRTGSILRIICVRQAW